MTVGDGIDERIKVEGRKVRIFGFDVYDIRGVVPKIKRKILSFKNKLYNSCVGIQAKKEIGILTNF